MFSETNLRARQKAAGSGNHCLWHPLLPGGFGRLLGVWIPDGDVTPACKSQGNVSGTNRGSVYLLSVGLVQHARALSWLLLVSVFAVS